jgi:outer membrane protein OmpA-like peptidoglycan-associated protein
MSLSAARVVLLALVAAGPVAAQEPPSPSDVRNPSLTTGSVSLTEGSVSFLDGSVNLTDGTVSFPTGTVAQPAQQSGSELRFELTADLLFDFDKADLRPEAEGVLRDVVAQIKAKAKRPAVRVEGHTDAKGTDAYNQDLSQRRSASVRGWLVQQGKLAAKSVAAVGLGEKQPVAPNEKPDGSDDPEGRQKNRRVEIVVTGLR